MRTIQTQVDINSDRQLNLQLPNDIEAGQYQVVVIINPQKPENKLASKAEKVSFADAAKEFIGCLDSDIEDLSHNPKYLLL